MDKEYTVKVTDHALEQLQEIQQYIAFSLQAPVTAEKWRIRMKKEMASLSFFPNRVMLVEEEPWHRRGIHKMAIGNYLVYFWIDESALTVWITAVVYGSRDQRKQLDDMPMT